MNCAIQTFSGWISCDCRWHAGGVGPHGPHWAACCERRAAYPRPRWRKCCYDFLYLRDLRMFRDNLLKSARLFSEGNCPRLGFSGEGYVCLAALSLLHLTHSSLYSPPPPLQQGTNATYSLMLAQRIAQFLRYGTLCSRKRKEGKGEIGMKSRLCCCCCVVNGE